MSKGPEGEAIKLARQRTEFIRSVSGWSVVIGAIEIGTLGLTTLVVPDVSSGIGAAFLIVDSLIVLGSVARIQGLNKKINAHSSRQHVNTYGRQTIVNRE